MSTRYQRILIFLFIATGTMSSVFKAPCTTDKQCVELNNPYYECREKHCSRKAIFPMGSKQIIGIIILTIISAFANAGGIGGGAIIVPVFIFLFDFMTAESIPLSKATIFAGAIMNIAMIINKKHPKNPTEPLIDFALASIMLPLLLSATMIGVIMTKSFPPIIIVVLLILYLTTSTKGMYKKAKETMQKETNMFEVERQEMNSKREPVQSFPQLERSSSDDESSSLMGETTQRPRETSRHNTNSEEISIQSGSTINIDKQALEDIIARSKDRSGVFVARSIDLFLLLLAFLSILVVALLRGGHGVESIIGLQTCSLKSMGLLVLVQIFCFSISLINYKRHKLELLGKETLSDFEENKSKLHTLLIFSYISGMGAGLLGIGGGMIINPIMIDLGYLAEVSSAISGFSVLWTSSSTTTQFIIAGAIDFGHALIFFVFSSLGSIVGNYVVLSLVEKYRRPSILIWVLFGLLFTSLLILPTMGLWRIFEKGDIFSFQAPC